MADAAPRREWRVTPEHAAGGMIKGVEETLGRASKEMLREAPKRARFVLKRAPGAPGLVYDVATLVTAKDKMRKVVGIAGSAAGGALGAGAGLLTGPGPAVASPLGAAAGSALGESAAEALYDNRLAIADWMKVRAATLTDGLRRDLQHYVPTDRLTASAHRR